MIRTCAVLLLLCLIGGCGTAPSVSETAKALPSSLHTETERGPVTIAVDIVPQEPRLSDEPTLTLTVTSADGVRVEMPPFGDSLGDFIIREFHEPLTKTADGNQIRQQIYTLEPTAAGTMSIEPIVVKFFDERVSGDGEQHEIETEALELEVATMVASEAPSLNDLRPVAGPVELENESTAEVLGWLTAIVLVFGLLGCLLWWLSRRKVSADPELTPHQLAWRELNDLLGSKLSETDVKEFFVQLTGVVRRYIERSTGVRAPELTTEEFLRQCNQQQLFSGSNNDRLGAFLESADLVKFAGYQPDSENVKQSTQLAKQFIELKTAEVIE